MSREAREREAAATLRACREALAAGGGSIIAEVLGGAPDTAVEWRHYPEEEVYDPASHAQYFYHRHPGPAGARRGQPPEHGHFHLFLRGEGMPAGIAPLLLPEAAVANAPPPRQSAPLPRGGRAEVCHLVAIAVDERGEPIRLFTTNRWVTGETWYRAEDVIRMLDRFRVEGERPSALLNRWLGAMVQLYEPEIAALLHCRDDVVLDRRWRWGNNVLDDTRLEIPSSLDIDLDARLVTIEAEIAAAPAARPQHPPRLAEGWGA